MSSNAWLNALGSKDLSQMDVQACWETNSPLKRIPHPHFDPEVTKRCKDAGVETLTQYGAGRRQAQRAPAYGRKANVGFRQSPIWVTWRLVINARRGHLRQVD